MTHPKHLLAFALLPLAPSACASDPTGSSAVAASAPALGSADSYDSADHDCQVVLRRAAKNFTGDGFEVDCSGESCVWVFAGSVDVADSAAGDGASVGVLYRSGDDESWWEVEATPDEELDPPGFVRFDFRLSEHLFGPEDESESSQVELVPFLRLSDGSRVFDHNANSAEFDNYRLVYPNFSVDDYDTCAPAVGTLWFYDNWDEGSGGLLREGGYLSVHYDIDRLPDCRNTHNGYPAWDTVAYVHFLPGDELITGSVRDFVSDMGTPTNEAFDAPLEVQIPAGATEVELWFRNYSGAGSSCETWDSNYGANYHFDIIPPADDPRCLDSERWTRIYGGEPHCLDYEVSAQYSATHCELYLNALGHGYEGHYGIPFEWLEAFIDVGEQDGDVLDVGMYTRYWDHDAGVSGERFSYGNEIEPGYWKTGFTFYYTGLGGSKSYHYDVEQYAFFVDVRRPTGEVVRLWQSRDGANYTWDDAFSLTPTTHYIPYGNVKYAADGSAVFDAKYACQ